MIAADAARLSILTDTGAARPDGFVAFAGRGSRLVIDHPLLREGPLDRIVLELVWSDFPAGRGGLGTYYRDYLLEPPIRDAGFVVTVAAPLSGWTGGRRRLRLFGAAGRSRFELRARGAKAVQPMPLTLALAAPAHGFGESGYAPALMAASARAAAGERAALPNVPWRALVSRVDLAVDRR